MQACIQLFEIIFSSDAIFDMSVKCDIFGVLLRNCFVVIVYLKNGIFRICFRQNAKCQLTTQTGTQLDFMIGFAI